MKKLIATDFDGTLNHHGVVSAYDMKQIERFRAKGNYFGVVTGRGAEFYEGLKERGIDFDYLIVYNGCLILDRDGNTLYEAFIEKSDFVAIEKFFEAQPHGVTYYDKTKEGFDLRHYYATCDDQPTALCLAEKLNNLYGDRITAYVNGPHINIGRKGTGKTQGVMRIAEHFGLSREDVFTVGDDYNDIDMIVAFNGYAVANAREDVLKKAPHICNSVGDIVENLIK